MPAPATRQEHDPRHFGPTHVLDYPGGIRGSDCLRVAIVGTHPPRRCGIATFTSDLLEALEPRVCSWAVALDDHPGQHEYPSRVRATITTDQKTNYIEAARWLNQEADIVNIQHEFGIFGGEDGAYILDLVRELCVPVVTTLHTVLRNPSPSQLAVIHALAQYSSRLVVMNGRGRTFLRDVYGIPEQQIAVIPHGIPDLPFADPEPYKQRLGLAGRKLILSFGLLSPSKGFEHVIEALPAIAAAHHEALYVVAGSTHPGELERHGERYRRFLEERAADLGVEEHLTFIDRFLPLSELCELLLAADVYVSPYPAEEQISSGTLAYALGSGTAVISTPYWHAQELLRDGNGVLVPFADPVAIAHEAVRLFDDGPARDRLRRQAYECTRTSTWEAVARRYRAVFQGAMRDGVGLDADHIPAAV
jgi:glycosyltransferase involved in cell wall biosynthesis